MDQLKQDNYLSQPLLDQTKWVQMQGVDVNLGLVQAILNWKVNFCNNASHFINTGAISNLAKDCQYYHQNSVDRRRPLCTQEFFNEVKLNYDIRKMGM